MGIMATAESVAPCNGDMSPSKGQPISQMPTSYGATSALILSSQPATADDSVSKKIQRAETETSTLFLFQQILPTLTNSLFVVVSLWEFLSQRALILFMWENFDATEIEKVGCIQLEHVWRTRGILFRGSNSSLLKHFQEVENLIFSKSIRVHPPTHLPTPCYYSIQLISLFAFSYLFEFKRTYLTHMKVLN